MSTMVTERLVSISAYFDYAQYKSLDGAGVEPCQSADYAYLKY
ncbi:MAG: hypothetical protein RMY16_03200 [Nostoc sp. DedQUE12b]|nr:MULTISPECIES: hypothetical protein [unclassified Nostoc]MDZ7949722.1 hypothetical protein [Nostoc sp. DedQUE09]MDZ8084592.1 hypothetical protein [Nostoc sp. DedQUE12b]